MLRTGTVVTSTYGGYLNTLLERQINFSEMNLTPESLQINRRTLHSCLKKSFCHPPFTKELVNEKHCPRSKQQKYDFS